MKKILLIIGLFLIIISCKAQTIPVEDHINYLDNQTEIPEGAYIKDINNKLGKFVGVWKGEYNNRNYEFRVNKIVYNSSSRNLKIDILQIKYKITEMNGDVIEDTTGIIGDSDLIIDGQYLASSGAYVLFYQGRESDCGQNGDLFINLMHNTTNKMVVYKAGLREHTLEGDCQNGEAEQYFPIEDSGLTLTKQ